MSFGGAAGVWGDAAVAKVKKWLEESGWAIIPAWLINNGGAPKVTTLLKEIVSPDLFALRRGEGVWAEVKYKDHCDQFRKRVQWQHGIDLPNWRAYLEVQQATGFPGNLYIVQKKRGNLAPVDPFILWQSFAELSKHVQIVDEPVGSFDRGAAYFPIAAFKARRTDFASPNIPSLSKNVNPWERLSKTGVAPQAEIEECDESPYERYACIQCGAPGEFGYRNRDGRLSWRCMQHRSQYYADARRNNRGKIWK